MKNQKFSLLLRRYRLNSGFTQRQVADALHVERSTYAYYETGVTKPSAEFIIEISKIFNVDYNEFMKAIADKDFNESEDGNGFTTLFEKEVDREKISTLARDEQNLIIAYRLMKSEQKEELMKCVRKILS